MIRAGQSHKGILAHPRRTNLQDSESFTDAWHLYQDNAIGQRVGCTMVDKGWAWKATLVVLIIKMIVGSPYLFCPRRVH